MSAGHFREYLVSSVRASWHGYSGGVYFVTVCTANKVHYFGEIDDTDGEPQIRLSLIGQYVADSFANLTVHYPYAEIPLFVVMPNHIHAIVIIDGNKTPNNVETGRAPSENRVGNELPSCSISNSRNIVSLCSTLSKTDVLSQTEHAPSLQERMTAVSKHKGYLSVVIGGMKSAVTRFARTKGISFGWQSRFYDRIVRGQDELNRIATYIDENIAKWQYDELNV